MVASTSVLCMHVLLCFVCLTEQSVRLEDPKDIIGMNAARRTYYADAEYKDIGKDYVKGSVWPKPQVERRSKTIVYQIFKSKHFFKIEDKDKEGTRNFDVLKNAIERYHEITFPVKKTKKTSKDDDFEEVKELKINVMNYEEKLSQDMNETYEVVVGSPTATLTAGSVWGALRGLETFSQLVIRRQGHYEIAKNHIIDFPRFSFRGFLVDTSRHFLPKLKIFQFLDAMAYSKFNVLHWHIVDDPSFPYNSTTYPELAAKGAFSKHHIYSQQDVQDIIAYAKFRGIRVMPEFDTPGHVHSWQGVPNLLTNCLRTSQKEDMFTKDMKGPINPVLPSTYDFLKKFFKEISVVFPEDFLHLGGDEVDFKCWNSDDEEIGDWLKEQPGRNASDLHTYYLNKLVAITDELKKISVVWQEVFDDNVNIKPDSTIVNVWKQNHWSEEMYKVTKAGFQTILSSPWYLNYISYGLDWPKFYAADPQSDIMTKQQKDLVVGGSACMWGEYVDATNVIQRSFGRSFPVAERLWSSRDTKNVTTALPRIWEHRCRYLARGIPAEPVTKAKFCDPEWEI